MRDLSFVMLALRRAFVMMLMLVVWPLCALLICLRIMWPVESEVESGGFFAMLPPVAGTAPPLSLDERGKHSMPSSPEKDQPPSATGRGIHRRAPSTGLGDEEDGLKRLRQGRTTRTSRESHERFETTPLLAPDPASPQPGRASELQEQRTIR